MPASKAISKPDYVGLEKLSKYVSGDNLVLYLICLCAGQIKGNGAIAAKINVGPSIADAIKSWLIEGNLIDINGAPTEYGSRELGLLKEQKKKYVIELLEDKMPDGLKYFLGLESQENLSSRKEHEPINPITVPDEHDAPAIHLPLPDYAEKKSESGNVLADSDSPENILEYGNTVKKQRCSKELTKRDILEAIREGIKSNIDIGKILDTSPNYVSILASELRHEGLVDGEGSGKEISDKGREVLKSYEQGKDLEVPAKTGETVCSQESAATEDVKCKEEVKPVIHEAPKSAPSSMPENSIPQDTKIKDIIGVDGQEIDDGSLEDSKVVSKNALLALKFLMGIESKLDKEEMELLFAGDGGLYLVKSRLRRYEFFSKKNGIYALEKSGSLELAALKEECGTFASEYFDIIEYLQKNKAMPPAKAKPEKKPASAVVPDGNVKEPTDVGKTPAKIERQKVSPYQIKAEPIKSINLAVTKLLEDRADAIKAIGLQKAGNRCVARFDDHQRTVFANNHLQQIGRDYLNILRGDQNDREDILKYQELKYLGWITGNNGDTTKTEKGENAQHLLEQFISLSNMVA